MFCISRPDGNRADSSGSRRTPYAGIACRRMELWSIQRPTRPTYFATSRNQANRRRGDQQWNTVRSTTTGGQYRIRQQNRYLSPRASPHSRAFRKPRRSASKLRASFIGELAAECRSHGSRRTSPAPPSPLRGSRQRRTASRIQPDVPRGHSRSACVRFGRSYSSHEVAWESSGGLPCATEELGPRTDADADEASCRRGLGHDHVGCASGTDAARRAVRLVWPTMATDWNRPLLDLTDRDPRGNGDNKPNDPCYRACDSTADTRSGRNRDRDGSRWTAAPALDLTRPVRAYRSAWCRSR